MKLLALKQFSLQPTWPNSTQVCLGHIHYLLSFPHPLFQYEMGLQESTIEKNEFILRNAMNEQKKTHKERISQKPAIIICQDDPGYDGFG